MTVSPKAIASAAHNTWSGDLMSGAGRTSVASSALPEFPVNWKARSEGSATTTTPEELLAAAHASCYSMALSNALGGNGTPATSLDVDAVVTFVPGTGITTSVLSVSGVVPGIDAEAFATFAADAKANCPVSQALSGVEISLGTVTFA